KKYEGELRRREARQAELAGAMLKVEDEAIRRMPAEDQRAAEGPDRPQVLRKLKPYLKPDEARAYSRLRAERARLARVPAAGRGRGGGAGGENPAAGGPGGGGGGGGRPRAGGGGRGGRAPPRVPRPPPPASPRTRRGRAEQRPADGPGGVDRFKGEPADGAG